MRLVVLFKKVVMRFLRIRSVNAVVRFCLRPLVKVDPWDLIVRIPVAGKVVEDIQGVGTITLETDGRDLVAAELFWRGINGFEKETIPLFLKILQHADTVLDVGANTGLYTLLAASQRSTRRVLACEPVPGTVRFLKNNVHINNCSNVTVFPCAIADFDGDITLYIPADDHDTIPLSSSTLEGFRETAEKLLVPAMTIDTLVARAGISRVDLLKIDTEGTEHLVLKGAISTLRRDEPIIICEVLWGLTEDGIHRVLDELGYQYFWITDRGIVPETRILGDSTYQCRNHLFVTKKRINELSPEISFG